jgi:hypothetical protein
MQTFGTVAVPISFVNSTVRRNTEEAVGICEPRFALNAASRRHFGQLRQNAFLAVC